MHNSSSDVGASAGQAKAEATERVLTANELELAEHWEMTPDEYRYTLDKADLYFAEEGEDLRGRVSVHVAAGRRLEDEALARAWWARRRIRPGRCTSVGSAAPCERYLRRCEARRQPVTNYFARRYLLGNSSSAGHVSCRRHRSRGTSRQVGRTSRSTRRTAASSSGGKSKSRSSGVSDSDGPGSAGSHLATDSRRVIA